MPESCREHYDTLLRIEPEGERDFWEFVDPSDKGKTFHIDRIVEMLYDRLVPGAVEDSDDWGAVEPYLQILMDNNVGSIVYDW